MLSANIMSRSILVAHAKIAEYAQRYEDMCELMKRVVELGNDLNNDERNLLSTAYKHVTGMKRQSLRIVTCIEQKSKLENDPRVNIVSKYREKVESDLEKSCLEIIELIDNYLLKGSNSNLEKSMFYNKIKGDCYRYLCEASPIPDKQKKLVTYAKMAYSNALTKSQSVDPVNPIRLGLSLNYAVFLYEIQKCHKKAVLLAQSAFDLAMSQVDKLKESAYQDSTYIMQMLKDNIKMWTNLLTEKENPATDDDNIVNI